MLNILSFQLPVILFLQKLSNPVLNVIAQIITFLGEAPIPFLIILFVFWCLDKKKGILLASSLTLATSLMQVIKAIFRVPRPFMAFPERVEGMRVSTSTGFSFPSGHSTTTASFYGAFCRLFKKTWIKVICILLIVFVPLSRLYLGAHWPLDVISGVILGLLAAFYVVDYISGIYDDDKKFMTFSLIVFSLTTAIALAFCIVLETLGKKDPDLFRRIFHDGETNMAITGGLFLGLFLDRKYLNFQIPSTIRHRTLTYLLGLLSVIVAFMLFSLIPAKYVADFFAYFAAGLIATYLFPLVMVKIKFMSN